MPVPEELMEILVCPDCHGELEERTTPAERAPEMDSVLACLGCGLLYPVRQDIPVMLVEEAFRPGRP